jgi:hypothetical protein
MESRGEWETTLVTFFIPFAIVFLYLALTRSLHAFLKQTNKNKHNHSEKRMLDLFIYRARHENEHVNVGNKPNKQRPTKKI